ncbi:LacI family DNA-binding transcriptional regulator [Kribbella shirazensis]|uniref:LacI family transcriptional regulator n=1 Tax=Kribbella shirazensis TaxID=1105143 RepID=A0A7X5VIS2_9ACTN|nr:LacI family DNA-binding transcriptional regulator [Kribbella shirazensis]NIK61989.1 LacI family transcriptional regulator [Kribbella shirazensis]
MSSRNVQRKPPTIRDVAALAGVSMSTVSRVLNGSAAVSGDAAERVRRAVDQLDFVLSASARTVRPGVRSMTWGLLVDAVESHYFSTLIAELDRAAQEHGSTLLVSVTQKEWVREKHLIKEMSSRRVDGLFVVPANGDVLGERARMSGVPIVYVDRIPSGVVADVVTFDYYRAMAELVEGLWARGHRRIAFIGGEVDTDPGSRRFAAWNDILSRHGTTADPGLVSVGHLVADTATEAAVTMLRSDQPPTAVVTTTGLLLLGVLHGIVLEGADVEVVCSEEIDAAFLSPVPLTLVAADLGLLVSNAVELLTAQIDKSSDGPPETRLLPTGQIHYDAVTSLRASPQ